MAVGDMGDPTFWFVISSPSTRLRFAIFNSSGTSMLTTVYLLPSTAARNGSFAPTTGNNEA